METFSALLAICAGNSPVTGKFPSQRPVTPSFDVFLDLHLNKRLSKQSWGWWFETPYIYNYNEWRHMATKIWVIIGPGKALSSSPASPLLIDLQWGPITVTSAINFHDKIVSYFSRISFRSPRGQWFKGSASFRSVIFLSYELQLVIYPGWWCIISLTELKRVILGVTK